MTGAFLRECKKSDNMTPALSRWHVEVSCNRIGIDRIIVSLRDIYYTYSLIERSLLLMSNLIDEKTKEKLFMLLIMVIVALSFIYKIPKMIEAWEASPATVIKKSS